jgi:hypothetical protein
LCVVLVFGCEAAGVACVGCALVPFACVVDECPRDALALAVGASRTGSATYSDRPGVSLFVDR